MAATCRGVSPRTFLLTGREGAAEQLEEVGVGTEDSPLSVDSGFEEPEMKNHNPENIHVFFVETYKVNVKEKTYISTSEPYHHWVILSMSQKHPSSAAGELGGPLQVPPSRHQVA